MSQLPTVLNKFRTIIHGKSVGPACGSSSASLDTLSSSVEGLSTVSASSPQQHSGRVLTHMDIYTGDFELSDWCTMEYHRLIVEAGKFSE